MTASTSSVSPLRQRMLDDMRMRKLPPQTQIGFIRSVRQFAAYLKRSPDTATAEELQLYQFADSSSKCNKCMLLGVAYFRPEEYLVRRSVSKHFSRSVIKFIDRCQQRIAQRGTVAFTMNFRMLGKQLAEQRGASAVQAGNADET